MSVINGKGSFIDNSFLKGNSISLISENPSSGFSPVFAVESDLEHVNLAVESSKNAQKKWQLTAINDKKNLLINFKNALLKYEEKLAFAISSEMGKIYSEALTEVKGLCARIDLMLSLGLEKVKTKQFYDIRAETRYQCQGVLAVIGPFNFPVHLVHSHVIPSILLGNTVVIKPSENCPWVSEIYAEAILEAGFPKGVINIVLGKKETGQSLCNHPDIDGVIFTGSYNTGRILQEDLLDQPHKILALELGGKNMAVVMDDAFIPQALSGILEGALLTTGQRCTATSRVLVHEKIYHNIKEGLLEVAKDLKSVHALKEKGLFGPLASQNALKNYFSKLEKAHQNVENILLESRKFDGGAYVSPSIYEISPNHEMDEYLSEELFGPNIALESFSDLDQAISRVNQSPYGLSNAFFTLNTKNFEYFYSHTKSGLVNLNRSTNRAFGLLPFGGVNKSGNQRPAGIEAVKYASFPVAICKQAFGEKGSHEIIDKKITSLTAETFEVPSLLNRHSLEVMLERYGIFPLTAFRERIIYHQSSFKFLESLNCIKEIFGKEVFVSQANITFIFKNDSLARIKEFEKVINSNHAFMLNSFEKPTKINLPDDLFLPKSEAALDRLYFGDFVPKEKKPLVVDLNKSQGSFLTSIDDNPLVIIDAASQIASVGSGLNSSCFQNAYDEGKFHLALQQNCDLALENNKENPHYQDALLAKNQLESFLQEKIGHGFKSFGYGASGAEANEIAFDLCFSHTKTKKRIIAFEGSFHGRTILALHATYNKEKRGPFIFDDYEVTFIPFPKMNDPENQPSFDKQYLTALYNKEIPVANKNDALFMEEINSLNLLKKELEKNDVGAVIIEPMQCEGGDKYASNRFFNGLRGLTKAFDTPLIFDEVQTGFHLGNSFFWHQQFNLKDPTGKTVTPDCVTLGKKAQLGICLSVYPNNRSYSPHIIQLKKSLLHAKDMNACYIKKLETTVKEKLKLLTNFFPNLVLNPRSLGLAFAFDMPSKQMAMDLVNQRFSRGFMAYIAGEKTIRFRLNVSNEEGHLNTLFENIFCALSDMNNHTVSKKTKTSIPSKTILNYEFIILNKENFKLYQKDIERIEKNSYEKERVYSIEEIKKHLLLDGAFGAVLSLPSTNKQEIIGFCMGYPANKSDVLGPQDDHLSENTFYSSDCTVDEKYRGQGFGKALKQFQIEQVLKIKNSQNEPRYHFMSGRNKESSAQKMLNLNYSLGGYLARKIDNQYGNEHATANYYRIPLRKSSQQLPDCDSVSSLNCTGSVQKVFNDPASINTSLEQNHFRNYCATKLTLSNWATTNLIRYSEFLRELLPKPLTHAYFTSGRDEVVDKGVRSIKYHRPQGQYVIGFTHQYFGQASAAARSLTHSQNESAPFSYFDWPLITHPQMSSEEQAQKELLNTIDRLEKDRVIAIVIELVGEKSGFKFSNDFLLFLNELRKNTGIPLIFSETASGFFRNGKTLFLTESLPVKPNMIWWYTGGQLGHVFVDDKYFVSKPLTLISTWDGDEVSILRSYNNLKDCLLFENKPPVDLLAGLKKHFSDFSPLGSGLWTSLAVSDATSLKKAQKDLEQLGVFTSLGYENRLMLCPYLDFASSDLEKLISSLKTVLTRK